MSSYCERAKLIDLTSLSHVTKCVTDSERKAGYYAAILSGKNDCGLWSLSTAEQFASSFLTSAGSDFADHRRACKAPCSSFNLLSMHLRRTYLAACQLPQYNVGYKYGIVDSFPTCR